LEDQWFGTTLTAIFFCCVNRNASPFEKGFFGLLGQLRWVLYENVVMTKELDFRKISDLMLAA
jgi:hypothetical protein